LFQLLKVLDQLISRIHYQKYKTLRLHSCQDFILPSFIVFMNCFKILKRLIN
jgi:hypothetical protein